MMDFSQYIHMHRPSRISTVDNNLAWFLSKLHRTATLTSCMLPKKSYLQGQERFRTVLPAPQVSEQALHIPHCDHEQEDMLEFLR